MANTDGFYEPSSYWEDYEQGERIADLEDQLQEARDTIRDIREAVRQLHADAVRIVGESDSPETQDAWTLHYIAHAAALRAIDAVIKAASYDWPSGMQDYDQPMTRSPR